MTSLQRRTVLLSSAAALSAAGARAAPPDALTVRPGPGWARDDATAVALQRAMAEGRTSSQRVVRDCLARITALDRKGPALHSVLEVSGEALKTAAAMDAERQAGRVRGPLHGVPVLLKDNIATADGTATTAGSLALAGVKAAREAHLVRRLREAGAVVLGKNNLSEWANIRSTRSTSGWSALGGLVKNPYALDRNTSGSSSGTAAAIAASLAPLGVGTETDGSIVSPASICGLVGLKPTVGRISRDGVVPISHTQDTAGPMTRTVADCALLFAAMAGSDDADAATARAPAWTAPAWDANALRGARLGIAKAYLTGFDEADALFGRCVAVLREAGAEIVEDAGLPAVPYGDAELKVLLVELKHNLPLWLSRFAPQAGIKTLADVIAFNKANAAREMPWFAQELFERAQDLPGIDDAGYREALAACAKGSRDDGIDAALSRHKLDALIAPTGGLAWLSDPVGGDHYGASFSTPAAVAGYPHLTVPAGLVRGLPLGLSFVGPAWSEARLLALGAAFERAAAARRPPRYLQRSVG